MLGVEYAQGAFAETDRVMARGNQAVFGGAKEQPDVGHSKWRSGICLGIGRAVGSIANQSRRGMWDVWFDYNGVNKH